jgi:hypothetical protein
MYTIACASVLFGSPPGKAEAFYCYCERPAAFSLAIASYEFKIHIILV